MKSLAYCLFGLISGVMFSGLSVYLYELNLYKGLAQEKEEKESPFYILHSSDSWEPVNASPFGVGAGNKWALMIMDGSWRTLVITTYTPLDREGKTASVRLSTKFFSEAGTDISQLVEPGSPEEKKLIDELNSLDYANHQEAFKDIVSEYIATLSDRSKFVYGQEEMKVEPADTTTQITRP